MTKYTILENTLKHSDADLAMFKQIKKQYYKEDIFADNELTKQSSACK